MRRTRNPRTSRAIKPPVVATTAVGWRRLVSCRRIAPRLIRLLPRLYTAHGSDGNRRDWAMWLLRCW